jgi:hypothetical protein
MVAGQHTPAHASSVRVAPSPSAPGSNDEHRTGARLGPRNGTQIKHLRAITLSDHRRTHPSSHPVTGSSRMRFDGRMPRRCKTAPPCLTRTEAPCGPRAHGPGAPQPRANARSSNCPPLAWRPGSMGPAARPAPGSQRAGRSARRSPVGIARGTKAPMRQRRDIVGMQEDHCLHGSLSSPASRGSGLAPSVHAVCLHRRQEAAS